MKFLHKNALIDDKKLQQNVDKLSSYKNDLIKIAEKNDYSENESSINLPFDENILTSVIETRKQMITSELKYVIVVGIGGSDLGTKAVYDAIYGYADLLEPERFPKAIFLETTDARLDIKTKQLLLQVKDPKEVLVVAVSKSGTTMETLENLDLILEAFPKGTERLVVVTGKQSSLWKKAQRWKAPALSIPKKIGGRFSMFSAVSLLPLACLGIDIAQLSEGAMFAKKELMDKAVTSAATIFSSEMKISNTFFFNPALESVGKWYRQLVAESLGKEGKGITPTVSIGSADLHSVEQLYLGGPKDKILTLVKSPPMDETMKAIYEGAKAAYKKNKIPFMEVLLDNVGEKSLGKFFQFKMLEIMFLAKLMDINAFDQPNVEDYKRGVRKILAQE